eukprot:scaffold22842_cov65-Phaeocystis_antarctica.AAC.1
MIDHLAHETSYVKKSKVQGSSFEVGAKVTYEGREMTVSMAPDSDGDIKMIDHLAHETGNVKKSK